MNSHENMQGREQQGSVLIYILVAVALLAALTVSLMDSPGQQSQSQNATNLVADLDGQIALVSAALSECVLSHPNQDSELTTTEQKNAPYPINPADAYFDNQSADPGSDTDNRVANIRCPGNPGGDGSNNQDHARIFGGSSGKFMPPHPALFGNWDYYNGADGVAITIASDKTDLYIADALAKLNDKYAQCEAEVIDRRSLGALNITSDTIGAAGPRQCGAGEICFRYWVILKPTAIHQDTPDCP